MKHIQQHWHIIRPHCETSIVKSKKEKISTLLLIVVLCPHTRTHARTHTHTQPFNGRWSGTTRGGTVPEETITHSHPSWSSDILYQLPPFTTIHCILCVQFTCLTVLFDNLSPGPLLSSSWSWTLYFILHAFLHPAPQRFSTTLSYLLCAQWTQMYNSIIQNYCSYLSTVEWGSYALLM